MLLHAAEGATDEETAATLRVGLSIVHRTRQRFVEEGLPGALTERRGLWRHVNVTAHRTKGDFAVQMKGKRSQGKLIENQ